MNTAKRLTVSMTALLAGLSFAHAQTAPGADPHHPDAQAPGAKAGAPMTPGAMGGAPGAPAGMDMGKMMGGGMEHMMPMMQMMRGMMAQGGGGGGMDMMPGQHIEGRIAFLKAELGVTDAQLPQWNAYADARRAAAKSMQAAMTAHMGPGMATTAPARSDAMIAMMTARLEAMKTSAAADKALYAVLTDAQKKTADELMMSRMGGM
jgi:hypothetical protein